MVFAVEKRLLLAWASKLHLNAIKCHCYFDVASVVYPVSSFGTF